MTKKILTSFILLFTTLIFAQNEKEITVKGKIVDASTQTPLEYATIVFTSTTDASDVTGGITDTKGNYNIKVAAGTYNIQARNGNGSCVVTGSIVVIDEPTAPTISNVVSTNPTDCGVADGTITFTASSVKAGTVLPLYPVMQYTWEKPVEQLTLNIYYKIGREVSELYEDRGEGIEYKMGQYSLKTFEFRANDKGMILDQRKIGDFQPTYTTAKLNFIGFPAEVKAIEVDGEIVEDFVVKSDFQRVIIRF